MQKHQTCPCFSVVETRAHQSTSTPKTLCRTTFRWQNRLVTKNIMKQKHTLNFKLKKTNRFSLVVSNRLKNMRKSQWIMLSWIWVNVQKRWKLPRNAKPQNLQTFGETEAQSHQDPSAKATWQSSFTLRERWTQVAYCWTFFCLVVCFGSSNFCGNRLQVGYSCQRRCLSAAPIRSWVFEELGTNGTKKLTKLNDLLWSQSYWDSRYFEPNSDRVCSYDNPLEWWYGGMVIWPKLNVPCCIALNFRANFAGRQRRKTDDRSDGFECVEWGWVMWRKSMTRGEKRFFRSFPQTLRNSVMFLPFFEVEKHGT